MEYTIITITSTITVSVENNNYFFADETNHVTGSRILHSMMDWFLFQMRFLCEDDYLCHNIPEPETFQVYEDDADADDMIDTSEYWGARRFA